MTEPEAVSWGRLFFATATVGALMAGLAFVLKWFSQRGCSRLMGTSPRRMRLVETLALDMRRRLVIVEADGKEHLLLLGQTNDMLIASRPASQAEANADRGPHA